MTGSGRLITVVDCGLGNIHSLLGCLRRLAPDDRIEHTDSRKLIEDADCVFLPGDGAFGACAAELESRDLRGVLIEAAGTKPFFGICVGMQMLFERSEESDGGEGLGVLEGTVRRFPALPGNKIPLMGWLDVRQGQLCHPLTSGIEDGERFYFLHSYHASASDGSVALVGSHGTEFAAAVGRGNLFATQFHPEKSGQAGVALLGRFLAGVKQG